MGTGRNTNQLRITDSSSAIYTFKRPSSIVLFTELYKSSYLHLHVCIYNMIFSNCVHFIWLKFRIFADGNVSNEQELDGLCVKKDYCYDGTSVSCTPVRFHTFFCVRNYIYSFYIQEPTLRTKTVDYFVVKIIHFFEIDHILNFSVYHEINCLLH
jgi:hypothetical protein